jgi:hypothetical protein
MSEADAGQVDGQPPAPVFTDGTIIFHCPRGHRLVVAAKYAGKRGRCDKKGCGAPVTIPVPPPVVEPSMAPPAVAGEPVDLPVVAEEMPADAGPELAPATDAATTDAAGDHQLDAGGGGWDFISAAGPPPASAGGAPFDEAFSDVRAAPDHDAGFGNPTARLVARLWEERDHGGIVELHLAGGSVILPEWYEVNWSRGTHGLFASQAPDGTVTLTAVAWDTIQKVVVRQVRDLPDGLFE